MKSSHYDNQLVEMLSQFCASVGHVAIYGSNHPLVPQNVEKTYSLLCEWLENSSSLTIFLVGKDIIVQDHPLRSLGPLEDKFTRILKEKGVERVTFLKGVSLAEFSTFTESLADADVSLIRSQPHIKLGKVEIRTTQGEQRSQATGLTGEAKQVLEMLLSLRGANLEKVKELYSRVKRTPQIDTRSVSDTVQGFIRGFRNNIDPISLLAEVKHADEYTFTHVVNVCVLTIAQAERLDFSARHLHEIGVAAMVHDIGKIAVPLEILGKPGVLTAEERTIMESHTVNGGLLLLGCPGVSKISVFAAIEHHLKYDGSGYPFLKPGWTPSVVAQMISIADAFDAMRSRRVYSEPKPVEVIREILLKEKGASFNPILVDNFLELISGKKMHQGIGPEDLPQ